MTKIIFQTVLSNKEKLQHLFEWIQNGFNEKKKLILFAKDDISCRYFDDLFWKYPQSFFLPHEITQKSSYHPFVITDKKENLNQAEIAINLTENSLENIDYELLYEFLDQSDPAKQDISYKKKTEYEQKNLSIFLFSPFQSLTIT